jgi:hypothetical protein
MQTRQKKAGLVLGAVFLMIPGRWAAAAEGAPAAPPAVPPQAVEGSTPPVQSLPAPDDFYARAGGPAFYTLVGRPDLRQSYEVRRGGKAALRVVGGLSLIVGALWWYVEIVGDDSLLVDCTRYHSEAECSRVHAGPDLMMLGGLAALILPAFIEDDPLSLPERAELLRKPTAPPRLASLALAPRVDRDGALLALAGRF